MEELKLFSNPKFQVRIVMRESIPWFVAKDVSTCIGHSDTSAMCKLCREKDKFVASARDFNSDDLSESGNSRITLVSESGLYRILAKCNLPKCEPFESWVFDEVLPEIRKTGSYGKQTQIPSYMIEDLETRAIAWAEEHKQARLALEAKEAEVKSLQAEKDVLRQEYMSNKDFCNSLIAQGLATQTNGKKYALETLRGKLSPILQEISHRYGYSISEEKVVVEGVERATPFYHKDVCAMIKAVVSPKWLRTPDTALITDTVLCR